MEIEITISVISAIILGLIQICKGLGLNKKWSPVIALVLGIFFVGSLHYGWSRTLIVGIITGLSAVGLFSGTKNLKEAVQAWLKR